ncbi:MAG: manganese-dependent inorganic pyrophosphatase [Succinivibrionaceae bacterium]|nr:manganese-dependent inorganic pyrophosphatase [Succinivibrionaceae bacterium]
MKTKHLALALLALPLAALASPALVFGHKSPDTDTIAGAIGASAYYNARGLETVPAAQGAPNPETRYLLRRFGLPDPKVIDSVGQDGFYIVDFSDTALAPRDFSPKGLRGIIDHHKLGDATSAAPIECVIMPYGSACTIIYELFTQRGLEIRKDIAGMLLGAVLSDTLNLTSETTVDADRAAVAALARIAGVEDPSALFSEMFRAKASLDDTPANLLHRDYKEFDINGHQVGIGQLDLLEMKDFGDDLKAKITAEMERAVKEDGLEVVMLSLNSFNEKQNALLLRARDPRLRAAIAAHFKVQDDDSLTRLEGLASRKKHLVPPLYDLIK